MSLRAKGENSSMRPPGRATLRGDLDHAGGQILFRKPQNGFRGRGGCSAGERHRGRGRTFWQSQTQQATRTRGPRWWRSPVLQPPRPRERRYDLRKGIWPALPTSPRCLLSVALPEEVALLLPPLPRGDMRTIPVRASPPPKLLGRHHLASGPLASCTPSATAVARTRRDRRLTAVCMYCSTTEITTWLYDMTRAGVGLGGS